DTGEVVVACALPALAVAGHASLHAGFHRVNGLEGRDRLVLGGGQHRHRPARDRARIQDQPPNHLHKRALMDFASVHYDRRILSRPRRSTAGARCIGPSPRMWLQVWRSRSIVAPLYESKIQTRHTVRMLSVWASCARTPMRGAGAAGHATSRNHGHGYAR